MTIIITNKMSITNQIANNIFSIIKSNGFVFFLLLEEEEKSTN